MPREIRRGRVALSAFVAHTPRGAPESSILFLSQVGLSLGYMAFLIGNAN